MGLFGKAALAGVAAGVLANVVLWPLYLRRAYPTSAPLLVFRRSLPVGTVLQDADLEVVQAHPQLSRETTFPALDPARGRVLTCRGVAGELVLEGCLAPRR